MTTPYPSPWLSTPAGNVEPSSPAGPEFDERDVLLGNDDGIPVDDEEEGEELFGDNFERYQ